MTGADAIFVHLERPGTPLHTLKVAVLGTGGRRRPITLDDLRLEVSGRLDIIPRATQRVVSIPGPARPFWVDDPTFDVDNHLDEHTLAHPGGRSELDALYSELATRPLDTGRPLWSMSLVHGLASGQQAVVVRVHHSITDGLGAVNALHACTTPTPGETVPFCPPPPTVPVGRGDLYRAAARDVAPWLRGLGPVVRDGVRSWKRARTFRRGAPDLPPFLGTRRNFCNTPSSPTRVCASATLAFDELRAVARATDTTVNGVLHAVIAGAMRDELLARGHDVSSPTVAAFGIAADPPGSDRRWGNSVTPTNVALFSNLADPLERLRRTARSCREGVDLRRATGLDMAARWADYACRAGPAFQRTFAYRLPRTVNHVTTANVAGPSSTRWLGTVEVVDWFSFAVAVPPSNLNITAYSYAGRMNLGLVTTPEVLPNPSAFIDRMASALSELVTATTAQRPPAEGC